MNEPQKLVIVWSTTDTQVIDKMILMYAHAAKTNKWFNEVILVLWGPSTLLVKDNNALQSKLFDISKDGVIIKACRSCTDSFGITEDLEKLGYEVKYMGETLTHYLKSDAKVLTF